ncbi:MAG: hypothetical protein M5U12_25470 [Verrucomicrobia bacterium]|nr:hypothetical protein [Verrucomicrobiota bacterium]
MCVLLSFTLFALTCGCHCLAADKSGVSPNTISLPKGPGSIEGLGESFQPTLNTGTAKYGVGLTVPPGVAGQTPTLALHYEGGSGNGPLGFGWNLSVPTLQRRTDEGIPTYGQPVGFDRTDVFINDSKEELVLQSDGFWFSKNESAFARYRFIPLNTEPSTLSSFQGHWEATLPDGTRQEFGLTDGARIQSDAHHIFSWLLERETDTRGNLIEYSYISFPDEMNLHQKYIATIRYGPGAPPWSDYHFVVFQYEDRPDWFEDCRPGFPVRTGKRLKSVVIGTQGPTLAGHAQGDFDGDGASDNLVRRYDLEYVGSGGDAVHGSLLGKITVIGADGASSLPPSTFGYTMGSADVEFSAAGRIIGGENEPPWVMDNALVELVDLNGDGLPDLLKTDFGIPGYHQAYLNRGESESEGRRVIRWSEPLEVASATGDALNFGLASTRTHLADMDGDGLADLVHKSGPDEVFYFVNRGRLAWSERTPMSVEAFPPRRRSKRRASGPLTWTSTSGWTSFAGTASGTKSGSTWEGTGIPNGSACRTTPPSISR